MVVALDWACMYFGGIDCVQSVFYRVSAAVIRIIVMSAKKLMLKSVGKDKLLGEIYLLQVAITAITESEVA
jgi:chromate transporter